ncbi:MAG TPA: universal stress protein [Acidimicrobiales bacterium]|nr:universal stress protein [Acidimicrobiales bacterium]
MTETPRPDERLLVFGDDGSSGADVAWLWVCNHRWPQWRAEVLTATQPPMPPPPSDQPVKPVEWDSTHRRRAFAESELTSIRTLTVAQDPRIMLGARSDADLIVVGPRSLSRTKAMILGSTTEWILHHPPAPLAIIRTASPVRRVVVCVDGSEHAHAAARAFSQFPWAPDTEVFVVTAVDGRTTADGVAAAIATLDNAGITATVDAIKGSPTDMILDQIELRKPDLVVLGTRGLTGWKRLRLGSTAGTIVRAAHSSILVANADDGSNQD